jgi:spore coat protein CotH
MPKKPFRIKFDKKTSLFGIAEGKNFVLLADYMDASKMQNFSALTFSRLIKGQSSFTPTPIHVQVFLNGTDHGLYLFCEHIDEKEERLNLSQDNIWDFNSFSQFNFMIERDESTLTDLTEIENETYFKVILSETTEYVFALKYPQLEDFIEETSSGEIINHKEKFYSFFKSLIEYVTEICETFYLYQTDFNNFDLISEKVDLESLAMYAAVDQMFIEEDHFYKSFKMYKQSGKLLKFGPNWDYDSTSFGLIHTGKITLNPYKNGANSFQSVRFSEPWGFSLFQDKLNGFPLFKKIWNSLTEDDLISYLQKQNYQQALISKQLIRDCEIWYQNQYSVIFDNQKYSNEFITFRINFLKSYYNSYNNY